MKHAHKNEVVAFAAVALLVVAVALACIWGASSVSLSDLVALITGGELSSGAHNILVNVRLPRVLAAVLAGSALAVAGGIIQAVLDNPLASPNIIGINSGAGLAVLLAACFFPSTLWLPPIAAFGGAMISAAIIFAISLGSNVSRLTVVLAGIAITAVFGAGMNTIMIVNPDAYIGSSNFLVGGFSGVMASGLIWPGCYIAFALILAWLLSGKLNVLSLGDSRAHALGLNVTGMRIGCLSLAAVLAGAAVSFAGLLGFVGLIVPHVIRFFVGHDNRWVLPISAIFGAAFVTICDLIARVMFAPFEVPVGILMAFVGGPFFIFLILKNRRQSDV